MKKIKKSLLVLCTLLIFSIGSVLTVQAAVQATGEAHDSGDRSGPYYVHLYLRANEAYATMQYSPESASDSTTASISATAFNDDGDPDPYSGTGNNSCTAKRSGSFAGTQASYRLGASTVKTLVVGNV